MKLFERVALAPDLNEFAREMELVIRERAETAESSQATVGPLVVLQFNQYLKTLPPLDGDGVARRRRLGQWLEIWLESLYEEAGWPAEVKRENEETLERLSVNLTQLTRR